MPDYDNGLVGVVNGVIIQVSGFLWASFAIPSTRWENHYSKRIHDTNVVFKRFAFQVADNYTASVFIALLKPFLAREKCPLNEHRDKNCSSEIRSTVLCLLVTMATIDQVMEVRIRFILCGCNVFWHDWHD